MTASSLRSLCPSPSVAELQESFVGKRLQDMFTPAAVVDRAIVRRNCAQMLEACAFLDVSFRPHVKTHKTVEVTRLQVGGSSRDVKIVVSTVAEADLLLEYLLECQSNGRCVNILYGIPIPPSAVQRLAQLGKRLSPGSVSVLIDHHDQLKTLNVFKEVTGYPLHVFIKMDTGYGRAGVTHETSEFSQLISRLLGNGDISSHMKFVAQFSVPRYSHSGHSYAGSTAPEAMDLLVEEIERLSQASNHIRSLHPDTAHEPLILSVGATPTATSIQNLVQHDSSQQNLGKCIQKVKANHDVLELHAGVYAFLDLQQLATQASPSASMLSTGLWLSTTDIAFTVFAEVASVYGERESPEALIAAGTLALGREPCKSYQGWGIVSNWGITPTLPNSRSGWQVGRISQEHGILNHEAGYYGDVARLTVGQTLRVFPNHACVAGALFSWYLVVDSDLPQSKHDEIVDLNLHSPGLLNFRTDRISNHMTLNCRRKLSDVSQHLDLKMLCKVCKGIQFDDLIFDDLIHDFGNRRCRGYPLHCNFAELQSCLDCDFCKLVVSHILLDSFLEDDKGWQDQGIYLPIFPSSTSMDESDKTTLLVYSSPLPREIVQDQKTLATYGLYLERTEFEFMEGKA
ncbi:MAG: hypothetical protein Q9218_000723 [Villophora microphyllina]